MKRRWNVFVGSGFLLVLAACFSYLPFFVRYPITRDFPWANLLLFLAGIVLLALGLKRAVRQPEIYRGKVSGAILGALSVLLFGLFLYGILYQSRQLPSSKSAPQVGQKAPDFTLPDEDGSPVTLAALLGSPPSPGNGVAAKTRGAVLIFYRGYW